MDVAENLSLFPLGTRFVGNLCHCWKSQFAEFAETLVEEVAGNLAAGVVETLLVETLSAEVEIPRVAVARTPSAAVEDRLQSLAVAGN